jgi:hypothetical protein
MKPIWFLLLQAVLLASSVQVAAQGTLHFTTFVPGQGVEAKVRDWTTSGVPSGTYFATLYWGTSPSSIEPVYTLVNGQPTYLVRQFLAATGYVAAGKIAIVGAAEGASVYVQMRAWSWQGGSTYEEAYMSRSSCVSLGSSNLVLLTLGGDNLIPPAQPAYLVGLKGFTVGPVTACPEPAPVLLGVLGTAILLRCRRPSDRTSRPRVE